MSSVTNTNQKVPAADADIEVLTSLLEDAIEFMKPEDKCAYLEASQKCPQIVASESSAVDFLQFENYDIWKAAQRLVNYWQWRYDLFGERAFRSIFDLTGAGAFDEFDLRVLATKAHMILPNDVNGDAVLLFIRNKYGKEFFDIDVKPVFRQLFFFCEVLRHEQTAQGRLVAEAGGIIVLPRLPPWILEEKGWPEMVRDALPIIMKWGRYIVLSKEKSQKSWFQAIFPVLQAQILKKFNFTSAKIYCHDSEVDLKWKLVSLGLREDGIPESLGGSWDEKSFSILSRLPKSLEKSGCSVLVPNLGLKCKVQADDSSVTAGATEKISKSDVSQFPINNEFEKLPTSYETQFPLDSEIAKIPQVERYSLAKAQEDESIAILKESFQTKFLKFHNEQAETAARHVVVNWSVREKIFVDRYLLCMNQVGSGALDKADIQTLRTGFLALLPKDNFGNHVLLYNPSKLSQNTVPSQRRIWFYLLFLIMKYSLEDRVKISIIMVMSKVEAERKKNKNLCVRNIIEAFPLDVAAIHLILEEQGLKDEMYRKDATAKAMTRFGIPSQEIILHTAMTDFDFMCDELAIYGLERDHVPSFLGGAWEDKRFIEWQDHIIQQEALDGHHDHLRDEEKWQIIQKRLNQSDKSEGDTADYDDKLYETLLQTQKRRTLDPYQTAYASITTRTDIRKSTPENIHGNGHFMAKDSSVTSESTARLDKASPLDLPYDSSSLNQTIPVNILGRNTFDAYLTPQFLSSLGPTQHNSTVYDAVESNVRSGNKNFEGLSFSYRSSVTDYWRSRLN